MCVGGGGGGACVRVSLRIGSFVPTNGTNVQKVSNHFIDFRAEISL